MSVGTAIRNPRTFVAGKWNTFQTVLRDPETFYDELHDSDKLWRELGVLFVVGLASTIGGYFVASEIMSNIQTGTMGGSGEYATSGNVGIQVWGYGYRGLLGIFLLWLAFAAALYALSWLYSDRGSFFRIARYTAWAMIPLLIGNLVKSVGYVIAGWDAWDAGTIEADEGLFIQPSEQVMEDLWFQVLSEPAAIIGVVVGAVFIFWTAYIAAYGISEVRDIPVSDARKVAAVPAVAYFLYVLYRVATFVGAL